MISLVLGGARSGKSEVAERLATRRCGEMPAASGATVTYVATAVADRGDPEFDDRIARHRARRPDGWVTVEVASGESLSNPLGGDGVMLVDSLGTWLAGHDGFDVDLEELATALERRRGLGRPTVLVSDEVGLGVHPETHVGLAFRDALGVLNRRLGEVADDVLLVVAGRVLELPRDGG
ncbi:MAG: bifunctional adenosylcobinamide kinase/adenosylcobinamide-phosphate guanylyltransferase [Acidimicrobiales bacterium]